MSGQASAEKLGVYVSVPFCRAKCSFCNFASGVGNEAAVERYLEALVGEIRAARADAEKIGAVLPERADTVYFGGGTPSLLNSEQVKRIFAALRETLTVEPDAEVTLEAAPGQIAPEVLVAFQREGVNRVSLGVQSFVDRECSAVGRLHTGEECLAEIARLRAAGVPDVGADLIAGLPYQTRESWESSLAAAAGAGLTHLSVYMFEIDKDSRLGAEVLRGGERLHAPAVASEELAAELYERAGEALPRNGFAQYEISNFARAGFRSRHNRKYWTRAPYIGLGLDAHSMLRRTNGGDVRFANTDELGSYGLAGRTVPQVIDAEGAFEESLFLGLRMLEGVDVKVLEGQFGARVGTVAHTVEELVRAGLMTSREGRWALTLRGRLLSNEVFGELLAVAA